MCAEQCRGGRARKRLGDRRLHRRRVGRRREPGRRGRATGSRREQPAEPVVDVEHRHPRHRHRGVGVVGLRATDVGDRHHRARHVGGVALLQRELAGLLDDRAASRPRRRSAARCACDDVARGVRNNAGFGSRRSSSAQAIGTTIESAWRLHSTPARIRSASGSNDASHTSRRSASKPYATDPRSEHPGRSHSLAIAGNANPPREAPASDGRRACATASSPTVGEVPTKRAKTCAFRRDLHTSKTQDFGAHHRRYYGASSLAFKRGVRVRC